MCNAFILRLHMLKSAFLKMQPRSGLGARLGYPFSSEFFRSYTRTSIIVNNTGDVSAPHYNCAVIYFNDNSHNTHQDSDCDVNVSWIGEATEIIYLETKLNLYTKSMVFETDSMTISSSFLVQNASALDPTSSSLLVQSASALDPTATTVATPQKKKNLGGIMGGVFGALGLLAFLAFAVIVYRRRQRLSQATLVPLVHAPDYAQPLEKSERLARVLSQKAEVQSQRDRLRMDMETRARPGSSTLPSFRGVWDDERLQEQMEWMSQRILALEAQQRELESNQGQGLQDDLRQPPPDYSVTASGRN
ncbi:hypothetical protein D9615_001993 [Tricholomella constricta]|uniref:Uncharacterized protein n=1 Tax=Tricholomella constricta TaxID=117010 RepID=A0A8H5HPG7_9AGAR|nr:hypothetical protein D9615_001993 [Tricholomella constricta]